MTRTYANAAITGIGDQAGKAYFLLDDCYVRYDWNNDLVDDGFPRTLERWNLPIPFNANLDAALNGFGAKAGKTYFFKGSSYVRYDWQAGKVDHDFPLPISAWGFSGAFASGIGSALSGQGPETGKAFFFKGSQVVRFDWGSDHIDAGYPKSLATFGLPAEFQGGFDFALDGAGPHAGKAYFFKGRHYVRYDWATQRIDQGAVDINAWRGVFQMLAVGTGATRALAWVGAARDRLDDYLLNLGAPAARVDNSVIEAALSTHFKVDKGWTDSHKRPYLETIQATFAGVTSVLGKTSTVTHFNKDGTGAAGTVSNGDGPIGIYFDPPFMNFGPLCQTAMIAHEPVHYVDPKAVAALDKYEWGPDYDRQGPDDALHCPSSYVSFSQHIYYGRDTRYGAGKQDL